MNWDIHGVFVSFEIHQQNRVRRGDVPTFAQVGTLTNTFQVGHLHTFGLFTLFSVKLRLVVIGWDLFLLLFFLLFLLGKLVFFYIWIQEVLKSAGKGIVQLASQVDFGVYVFDFYIFLNIILDSILGIFRGSDNFLILLNSFSDFFRNFVFLFFLRVTDSLALFL